jgi:pimeloyl-ACP methyl ester carboxylesterase
MYATAFINEYGDYNGKIKGAILTEPGAFTDEQLRGFIDRLVGSVSLVGEPLNDAFWAQQFLSPDDHARADYQASLMAMHGAPAEHRDPKNPMPFWRTGAVVNKRMLSIAEDGFDWTTNLAAFPKKVLFLRGDLNEAATLEHQQELMTAYPNAEMKTITNVGHEMIWERTADYLIHARAYLREIGAAQ